MVKTDSDSIPVTIEVTRPHANRVSHHPHNRGAVVPWCSGAVVQWCSGAVVSSTSAGPTRHDTTTNGETKESS